MSSTNRKLIWRIIITLALIWLLYYTIQLKDTLKLVLVSVLLLINLGYLVFMIIVRKKANNQQE